MTGRVLEACGRELRLGERTLVMGILNVTPDSFSDGGRFLDEDAAVRHAVRLVEEGADLLDVGGESTRPGAAPVDVATELERVVPVVKRVVDAVPVPVSVDTSKAPVARAALAGGACIVNDVTALRGDADMGPVIANAGAAAVLMHMQGDPRTMQRQPRYDDVVAEVRAFLEERAAFAGSVGVPSNRIVVDPGIGFGKDLNHNLALLRGIGRFAGIGEGVLVGPSRKSFLGALTGGEPDDRLEGGLAAGVLAAAGGADILRVHDVQATVRALTVAHAILARGAVSP